MKRKRIFIKLYWAIIFLFLVVYLINDGSKRKSEYTEVKGEVIDQIYVTKRGRSGSVDVLRPQVGFMIGGVEYFFVDHFTRRPTGMMVTVLCKKTNPYDAQIYTWLFWVNFWVIIPTLIVSGFVFCIIWITITDYGQKPVVLRGEFDILL